MSTEALADLRGVRVIVHLKESSRADAPSTVVGEAVLEDPWARLGAATFVIEANDLDHRASYSISVLVDRDGDGRAGAGDSINVASYPVLTWGHPDTVRVEVRRVE